MTPVKRLLRKWLDSPTPEDGLAETNEILVRCARRCAYDLRHAADFVSDEYWQARFHDAARHWLSLFQNGNATKDYRIRLHATIQRQESTITALRKTLSDNGISDPTTDNETPF